MNNDYEHFQQLQNDNESYTRDQDRLDKQEIAD